MPNRCILCLACADLEKDISLHVFPKDTALCRKWTKFLNMHTKSYDKTQRRKHLCSQHFQPDSFRNRSCHMEKSLRGKQRLLKKGAIPSILTPSKPNKTSRQAYWKRERKRLIEEALADYETSNNGGLDKNLFKKNEKCWGLEFVSVKSLATEFKSAEIPQHICVTHIKEEPQEISDSEIDLDSVNFKKSLENIHEHFDFDNVILPNEHWFMKKNNCNDEKAPFLRVYMFGEEVSATSLAIERRLELYRNGSICAHIRGNDVLLLRNCAENALEFNDAIVELAALPCSFE